MKRFKWEPFALIILVVGLGMWLVWGNRDRFYGIKPEEGSRRLELRVGTDRGIIEVLPQPAPADPQSHRFRVMLRNGFVSDPMDDAAFIARYGVDAHDAAVRSQDNLAFRLLNITGWGGLLWAGIGLLGQVAFSGRMLVQWLVSEKRRESVVPEVFWWLSLGGGVLLFAYFVWRQDFVGVLGQSSGVVIYARNIKLIRKRARRLAQESAASAPDPAPSS
jgi:lipid-A-disaccharide synthase-like uncharacterized protein